MGSSTSVAAVTILVQPPSDDAETPAQQMRRGLVELRHEHWADAHATLAALVRREPEWADAHAYLSGAQIAIGQYNEAIDSVARALELDPDGFGPNLKAGELGLRLGHQQAAETHLLAAVRASLPASADESAAKALLTLTRQQAPRRHRAQRITAQPWSLAPARKGLRRSAAARQPCP